jgi:hypothetical protein
VTYIDTSVALAHMLAEDKMPPSRLWEETLVSSRLLEYELWIRLHARGLARSHGELAREMIGRLALLEMTPSVLTRALEPFPAPVRTLDAIHLASVEFLRQNGQRVGLATYDDRMLRCARRLHIPIYGL